MKQTLITLLLTTVLFASSCGSGSPPPGTQDVVGTYTGRYAGGLETIQIMEDGSFSQEFKAGTNTIYSSTGKWKLRGSSIDFSPLMSPDRMRAGRPDGIRDEWPRASGAWRAKPSRIEFGEWPYFVAKVSGTNAIVRPYVAE